MPYLDRHGVNLHYDLAGPADAPLVLITHGFSATSHMWRDTAAALTDGFRALTWDIRGHGRSDSPEDPAEYSIALTLDDMVALLDHAGAERAVLMGHSLGGYLSLAFHVEHAARVRGLVLMDTGPGYRNAEARARWNEQAEGRASYFEKYGLDGYGSAAVHGDQHRSARGLALAARGILAQHDGRVMDELPRIGVPALVVVGANDKPFLGASSYMAERIPGARQVVLPDAGHEANLDQPELFNTAVREFLEALPESSLEGGIRSL